MHSEPMNHSVGLYTGVSLVKVHLDDAYYGSVHYPSCSSRWATNFEPSAAVRVGGMGSSQLSKVRLKDIVEVATVVISSSVRAIDDGGSWMWFRQLRSDA